MGTNTVDVKYHGGKCRYIKGTSCCRVLLPSWARLVCGDRNLHSMPLAYVNFRLVISPLILSNQVSYRYNKHLQSKVSS